MDLTSVFNNHLDADRMATDDVRDLFIPPPGFSTCLRRTNQVIIGPRGSGKSMALRWLAFMPDRPGHTSEPPFYGLWLGIGRFMVDYLRQYYHRTADPRPFLAFLNLQLLEAIIEHIGRYYPSSDSLFAIPAVFSSISAEGDLRLRTIKLRAAEMEDFSYELDDYKSKFTKALASGHLGEAPTIPPFGSIQDTLSLLRRFHGFISKSSSHEVVALLLDGVDHLGELGRLLAPLMSKDERHAEWLLIKQTCRELPTYYYATTDRVKLEHGRDYHILPFGVYDSEETFEIHLHSVMGQRLLRYLPTPPPGIEDLLPTGTGKTGAYSGFPNLARFAGGNVLTFLEACGLALQDDLHRRSGNELMELSPEAQRKGIKDKAGIYLDSDLDEQVRDGAADLRDLLRAVGKYLESQKHGAASRGIEVSEGFLKSTSRELSIPYFDAVARLCEFRYFVVHRSSLVPTVRRIPNAGPQRLELSPTLAPLFSLDLASQDAKPIASADVDNWLSLLRMERGHQGSLFGQEPVVFLSRTGDEWGDQVQRRLEDAIRRIEKSKDYPTTRWSDSAAVVSFKEIEKRLTGNFRDNIFGAIETADYVVCDVTGGLSSGIAVEFGIAAGLRRPIALCWLEDRPMAPPDVAAQEFTLLSVPEELQGFDVKRRNDDREPFSRWYYAHIHQPCTTIKIMCAFRGSDMGCSCEEVERDLGAVYLATDARNRELDELLCEELQKRNFKILRREGTGPGLSETLCKRLRGSGGVLIDISAPSRPALETREPAEGAPPRLTPRFGAGSGAVRPLLEAGYAIGAGLPYGLFYDEQRGYLHSSMLPGRRKGIPPDRTKERVSEFIDWFIREQVEGYE